MAIASALVPLSQRRNFPRAIIDAGVCTCHKSGGDSASSHAWCMRRSQFLANLASFRLIKK
jgi:hypothetical protein